MSISSAIYKNMSETHNKNSHRRGEERDCSLKHGVHGYIYLHIFYDGWNCTSQGLSYINTTISVQVFNPGLSAERYAINSLILTRRRVHSTNSNDLRRNVCIESTLSRVRLPTDLQRQYIYIYIYIYIYSVHYRRPTYCRVWLKESRTSDHI